MNPLLTSRQYVEKGGVCCPFCGSEDISADDMNIEGGTISQEIGCNRCESEWYDVYILTGYEPKRSECEHGTPYRYPCQQCNDEVPQ